MSIERELLEKVISGDNKRDFFVSYDLYKEIYKFLAQHKENYVEMLPSELWLDGYEAGKKSALLSKQPEQEPVAWMYDHQIEVGYDKYTEVNIIETCARNLESNNCINIRPLYLAPPKREPLINIYVLNAFKADDEATHPYSYWAGVEFAEKHHGIGGGE